MKKYIFAAIIIIISFLFGVIYKPVAETELEPWKLRFIAFHSKTIPRFLAKVLDTFGIEDEVSFVRRYRAAISSPPENSSQILITEHYFDGVRVLKFTPANRISKGRSIVFYHGGGWVNHNPEEFGFFTRYLAEELNCIVISVDYRRAPEHPYPAAFEDCLAATLYVLLNAKELDIDPNGIALMGDSAGGNLAAAIGAQLHLYGNENAPKVKLVVVLYPVIQCKDFAMKSYNENYNNIMLSRDDMIYYCLRYLYGVVGEVFFHRVKENDAIGEKLDKEITEARRLQSGKKTADWTQLDRGIFSPIYIKNKALLKGHPLIYLVTCDRDVLHDDGIMYRDVLKASGVHHIHRNYDTIHGAPFFGLSRNYTLGKTVLNDMIQYMQDRKHF